MPPGLCRQMVTVASQAHPLTSADHSNILENGRWEGLRSGERNTLLFPVRLAVRTVSWGWPHQGGFWKHPHVIPNFCLDFCGKRCHSIWILGCVLKPPLPEAAANYYSSDWPWGIPDPLSKNDSVGLDAVFRMWCPPSFLCVPSETLAGGREFSELGALGQEWLLCMLFLQLESVLLTSTCDSVFLPSGL